MLEHDLERVKLFRTRYVMLILPILRNDLHTIKTWEKPTNSWRFEGCILFGKVQIRQKSNSQDNRDQGLPLQPTGLRDRIMMTGSTYALLNRVVVMMTGSTYALGWLSLKQKTRNRGTGNRSQGIAGDRRRSQEIEHGSIFCDRDRRIADDRRSMFPYDRKRSQTLLRSAIRDHIETSLKHIGCNVTILEDVPLNVTCVFVS